MTNSSNTKDTQGASIVPLGTKTTWGKVAGVTNQGGERYYMMTKGLGVALMPAALIESATKTNPQEMGGKDNE